MKAVIELYLRRAIEIGEEEMLLKVYANLGAYLAKTGNENGAADAYIKGFWLGLKQNEVDFAVGLLVRRALLIPVVSSSITHVEQDRIYFEKRISDVTELARSGGSTWENDESDLFRVQSGGSNPSAIRQIPPLKGKLSSWTEGVQTPHFFVHYKGYYDLPIQQAVSRMYTEICPPNLFEIAPHLLNPSDKPRESRRKVAFM